MFYFSKKPNQKHPHALSNIAFNAKFRNHSVKLCTPKLSKLYDKERSIAFTNDTCIKRKALNDMNKFPL
jgi:hypothetical protein